MSHKRAGWRQLARFRSWMKRVNRTDRGDAQRWMKLGHHRLGVAEGRIGKDGF